MFRPALKLLLALSLTMTGCIAEATSDDAAAEEAASELVMEPIAGEFEPIRIVTLPTSPTECGSFLAAPGSHCRPALQATPNGTTFDPDQRPPEDPMR